MNKYKKYISSSYQKYLCPTVVSYLDKYFIDGKYNNLLLTDILVRDYYSAVIYPFHELKNGVVICNESINETGDKGQDYGMDIS